MFWKRIFGKSNETPISASTDIPKAARRISLAEAKAVLSQQLVNDEALALQNCATLRASLIRNINELKSVVSALAAADVPEPTATASKAIKDGFAQRALAALMRITIQEWSNIATVQANISELERALAAVSVGPREAMHVKFFFEEHMASIAALIHTMFDVIAETRNRLQSAIEKRNKLDKILRELDKCEQSSFDKRSKLEESEREIKNANAKLADIQFNDLTELQRLRADISQFEKAIGDIDQQITSALSPATRLLKRFGHVADDKHIDDFIRNLEAMPANTFCANEERVRTALVNSLAAVRSGQISADEKEVRRAEDVLNRFDTLLSLRERRTELERKINQISLIAEQEETKERENSAAQTCRQSMENSIATNEMRTVELNREISALHEQSGSLKRELSEFAASVIGGPVELY